MAIALKAAVAPHAVIQGDFAAMAEWWVTEIVRARDGLQSAMLGQISDSVVVRAIMSDLARQAPSYLRDFQRMCQARAIEVTVAETEDLSLALQAAERS